MTFAGDATQVKQDDIITDVSEVVQQVALTGHPANSVGKILYDFYITRLTAARCGYLANINNANLATIGDISSLTATDWISYRTCSSKYSSRCRCN